MNKIITRISMLIVLLSLLSCSIMPFNKVSNRVKDILSKMSLRQKITQMMMVDFRYWDLDLSDGAQSGSGYEFIKMNSQVSKIIEDYNFGAVIYFAQNLQETKQSFQLSMDFQEASIKNNGIPLLICTDQEGGIVYRLRSGTALAGNMALGATNDPEYAKKAGEIIGSELSVLGINTNLAPVVDVNNNANNPVIGLRSYSDDAKMVGEFASATIQGLKKYNVIGCAKHFPGHGDTSTDSHYGLPLVNKTKEELMENELKPYKIAINNDIDMIMTAHILYPKLDNTKLYSNKTKKEESLPSTMSHKIVSDLLKHEMKFDGVVVSDAMNMAGVTDMYDPIQAVTLAITAGVDLICMPTRLSNVSDLYYLEKIISGVGKAVIDGIIPTSRIDDAVTRILTLKEKRGILDYNPADYSLEKAMEIVGSDENREIDRRIAAASVTVIKNDNNTLPLNITKDSKILMLCPYENEKAQMIIGYNRAKKANLIPEGTKVDVYTFSNADISGEIKDKLDWADTIIISSEINNIAIYSNSPNHYLYEAVEACVNYCKTNNKTSVVMSVDKPYDVQMYQNADAIIAVYGNKGSSVDVTEALINDITSSDIAYGPNLIAGIEVILGTFEARGKLPVNIYKLNTNKSDYTNQIVFERGYGLTYPSKIINNEINQINDIYIPICISIVICVSISFYLIKLRNKK